MSVAFGDTGDGGHDLFRGTVPALEGVVTDEGVLDRVQRSVSAQTLYRSDRPPVDLGGECQTSENPPAVNVNRAGAALTLVAPFFCAIEVAVLTKRVEQRDSRFDLQRKLQSIDPWLDRDGSI